jgi:hypothetical protein
MRPSNEGVLSTSDVETIGVLFGASGEDNHFVVVDPLPLVRTSYRLVTTPSLLAGQYFLTVSITFKGAASGTVISADIEIDGIGLGTILSSAGTPDGGFVLSSSTTVPWIAGVHTIEYFAWQSGGPSTASTLDAFTTWERRR